MPVCLLKHPPYRKSLRTDLIFSVSATPHGARYHNRYESWGQRLIQALSDRPDPMSESKSSLLADERIWYDQFTSTDWVHDSIADAYRVKQLRSRKGFWGRLIVLFDGAQGWILSAVVGVLVALVAYCVDVAETTIFDYKDGFCARAWYLREKVPTTQPYIYTIIVITASRLAECAGELTMRAEVLSSRSMYRLAILV